MKKIMILILVLSVIMAAAVLCSCEPDIATVTEQTGNLKYQMAEGWTSKAVSPSPSKEKTYGYGEYTVKVEALSYRFYEDPLQEALDHAIGETLMEKCQGAGYEAAPAAEDTAGELPAKEIHLESTDVDGNYNFSGIFTSIETETGLYVISTVADSVELSDDMKKAHSKLKETVEYTTEGEQAVYAKNIFQFGDYICAVPAWDAYNIEQPLWSSRVEYDNGVINYVSDMDISYITIVPMDVDELTDDVIVQTIEQVYNGKTAPAAKCSIVDREMTEVACGSGLKVKAELEFGEEGSAAAPASALFILNEDGQAVCCFCNVTDAEYDYSGIAISIQEAEPVYAAIDSLYEKATDFVGDNSEVGSLLNDLDMGWYGEYTFELQTAEEPYGLTVKYSEDIEGYDFQREAVILIGLIGNLDSVDIKDSDSDIVHYDYELVKSLMKYDVKKMASDKSKLETYYLETLY